MHVNKKAFIAMIAGTVILLVEHIRLSHHYTMMVAEREENAELVEAAKNVMTEIMFAEIVENYDR